MRKFLFFVFIICGCKHLSGQVNLTLNPSISQSCYDIIIVNTSEKAVRLAGQNYRLYYDAKNVHFEPDQLISFLPKEFTPLTIVQNLVGDATGYGALPFEKKLGFINLATDYHLSSGNLLTINAFNEFKVAQICFSDTITNGIVWADQGVTDGYATAFNEFSQLTESNTLEKLNIDELNVNKQLFSEEMPLAFELGTQKNPIEIDNNTKKVSSINSVSTSNFKNQLFNKKQGRYVVLATVNGKNENGKLLLEQCENIENNNGKFIFKYINDLEEAKTWKRRFINVGFEDTNLFSVSENGTLSSIKQQ